MGRPVDIEHKRLLDILHGISTYNVFLAILFATIGTPEAALATFVVPIAVIVKRVSTEAEAHE